jgi:outer membrane protein OmpA-like peptidoglycan-associated protein
VTRVRIVGESGEARVLHIAVRQLLLATSLVGASAPAQGDKREHALPPMYADSASRFAADLSAGRLIVRGITFDAGGATIDPSSIGTLHTLAAALHRTTGTYLIESHTSPGRGAQALSDRRAAAVRTWLLAAGVDPARLYAAGFGATRPRGPPKNGTSERIEISRVS